MINRPARILHVVGAMNRGGAESMIMSLYRNIDRSLFQFDFLEFSAGESDFSREIISLGGRILKCRWSQNPTKFIGSQTKLENLLKQEGPFAAVHSHMLFASGAVLTAAKNAGVEIRIAHSHNTSDSRDGLVGRGYHALARWLVRRSASAQIACSTDAGSFLFGKNFLKDGGIVVPNSVDLERFHPVSQALEGVEPETSRLISLVSVARFEPVKNHIFLIELAAELEARQLNFIIKFVGQGSLESELKEMIASRGLGNRIEMMGLRNDVEDILRNSDALLMPSLWEGLPVALVEAQATGLPCLVSETITRDADLGLGLLNYLSIEEVSGWADAIEGGFSEGPTSEEILVSLESRGYTIPSSLGKLLPLYSSGS